MLLSYKTLLVLYSGKKCKINFPYFLLLPWWLTKLKDRHLKKVIIDFKNCRGTEYPYVMVSCVTSLDCLLILHPFRSSKIKCQQSEDTQNEFKRLDGLRILMNNKLAEYHQILDLKPVPIGSILLQTARSWFFWKRMGFGGNSPVLYL